MDDHLMEVAHRPSGVIVISDLTDGVNWSLTSLSLRTWSNAAIRRRVSRSVSIIRNDPARLHYVCISFGYKRIISN